MAKMVTQLLTMASLNRLTFLWPKRSLNWKIRAVQVILSIFTGESSGYMGILIEGIFVRGQKCPKNMANLLSPHKPCLRSKSRLIPFLLLLLSASSPLTSTIAKKKKNHQQHPLLLLSTSSQPPSTIAQFHHLSLFFPSPPLLSAIPLPSFPLYQIWGFVIEFRL